MQCTRAVAVGRGGMYTRCHLICARGDKASGRSKGGGGRIVNLRVTLKGFWWRHLLRTRHKLNFKKNISTGFLGGIIVKIPTKIEKNDNEIFLFLFHWDRCYLHKNFGCPFYQDIRWRVHNYFLSSLDCGVWCGPKLETTWLLFNLEYFSG